MKHERFHPNLKEGLSREQVEIRKQQNLVNYDTSVPTKTITTIIRDNLFTLFNLLNFALALAIFLVGSHKNLMFLGVVFCNTLISTIQEIHSKRIVDKLSIVAATKVTVIRDHKTEKIEMNEVVLDDILLLKLGNQIVADAIVLDGTVEVNESCVTGESESVYKKKGDLLLSGSFIVSGSCYAIVEHVGTDNYTSKISSGAKYVKKINSELMKSLNKVIKFISFIIVPIGILLFINQIQLENNNLTHAVVNTVAALIGMIPEGLVLLTSTVLAVSVMRLAKHQVLVQELYCIETLARVDTICLDKTGTITEGYMEVENLIPLQNHSVKELQEVLFALSSNLEDDNATMDAISRKFNKPSVWIAKEKIPFSSKTKYSGVTFEKKGSYILGAPEIVLKDNFSLIANEVKRYTVGNRVILLAHSKDFFHDKSLPSNIEPLGLVVIRDKVRFQAIRTLEYFKEQGVAIKIISGDNVETVSSIAARVGLENIKAVNTSSLSLEELESSASKYNVFGRVTPDQKKVIIESLKKEGHTVAMTGDGVNDVLALKSADCSIAMASGSDAARNVSQLVLLESNFDAMPQVVAEGRRTINNIERSSSLFLVKTIYSTILAILFLFINRAYPFVPIQMTLTSMLTIGIPSFILALEPNKERIKGSFLINVLSKAFPAAMTIVLNIIGMIIVTGFFHVSTEQSSTLCVFVTAFVGFLLLYRISKPFNLLRKILFMAMIAGFVIGIVFFRDWFSLVLLSPHMYIYLAAFMTASVIFFNLISNLFEKIVKRFPKVLAID